MADFSGMVRAGVVEADGAGFKVNLDGAFPPVMWPGTGYLPQAGDNVAVLMSSPRAYVLGAVLPGDPRPMSGTVAGAASGGLLPITTPVGTVQARYTGTAPTTGTLVFLDWQSTTARIMAGAAATVAPPTNPETPPTPAPPPEVTKGTLTINAIDSGSWRSYGWETGPAYQGNWTGQPPWSGAWFYGGQAAQLAGATITRVQLRVGSRIRLGSYNNTLNAHIYRHSNPTRPSGDVGRVDGPADIAIAPNAGPGWHDIPASFWPGLVAGGGIGLFGAPYLALTGTNADPASGQLAFDWTR